MNTIKIFYDLLCDWPNDLDLLYNLTNLHFLGTTFRSR